MTLKELQERCREFIAGRTPGDGAHGIPHVKRVVKNVFYLSEIEGSELNITVPAAWLHDCVAVPKDSPQRPSASRLAAEAASAFLAEIGYPEHRIPGVYHAIEAHSYSAGVPAQTLEARVVQDADRLDSLGAIGIARCLLVGGHLGRPLCDPDDPFCETREPDDSRHTLDHFYAKLFKLPSLMHTHAGRKEAERRVRYMRSYLDQLRGEIL
ncbi:MAG: HD domain-containing protein [Lysobacterales bacterium]